MYKNNHMHREKLYFTADKDAENATPNLTLGIFFRGGSAFIIITWQ